MAISNVPLWQNSINSFVKLIEQFGQEIELQTRVNESLKSGNIDSEIVFETFATVKGAFDTNNRGKTFFDNTATEQSKTEEIYIEYIDGVDSETWVLYNEKRINIIDIENIGELNGILKLSCSERGTQDNKANEA